MKSTEGLRRTSAFLRIPRFSLLQSSYRSSGVVLLDEIYRDQRVTLIEDQVPKKDTATSQVRMERSDELCPQTQSSTKTGLGQAHKKRRGSSSGHAVVSDASAHPESKTRGGVESKRHGGRGQRAAREQPASACSRRVVGSGAARVPPPPRPPVRKRPAETDLGGNRARRVTDSAVDGSSVVTREPTVLRPPPPPPPGFSGRADGSAGPSSSTCIPEVSGAASDFVRCKPAVLPEGDKRFHGYQKLKDGYKFLGCRVCVCDNCGWWAYFYTKVLPWQGAFVEQKSIRRFFADSGGPYNVIAMRGYYERGLIDATWHCVWCLAKDRNRSVHQICTDFGLYSKKARRRTLAWCA